MINVFYQDEYIKCKPLVTDDGELRTVLNILHDIDSSKDLDLCKIGSSIFSIIPGHTHDLTPVQIQALANLGYVILNALSSENYHISREHLSEKIFLIFFQSVE